MLKPPLTNADENQLFRTRNGKIVKLRRSKLDKQWFYYWNSDLPPFADYAKEATFLRDLHGRFNIPVAHPFDLIERIFPLELPHLKETEELPMSATNYDHDPVKHPKHYTYGKVEVWDAIIAWNLDFLAGNVVKYVARARYKDHELEDLKKAQQYLAKLIAVKEEKEFAFRSSSQTG